MKTDIRIRRQINQQRFLTLEVFRASVLDSVKDLRKPESVVMLIIQCVP